MSSKSRRKRKRALALARGDRFNPSVSRTGKGVLFNWSDANVRDLILLQRAISTGRLAPDDKGRRIVDLVLKILDDPTTSPERRIEAFRALAVATGRANLRSYREALDDHAG